MNRQQATVFFKLGVKANAVGVHRTLNRPPKGKGWLPCRNAPEGMFYRPDKVRESIEHFKKAYEHFPDIVALNQIALAHEMLGEHEESRRYFTLMKEQAERESNPAYLQAAEAGIRRLA